MRIYTIQRQNTHYQWNTITAYGKLYNKNEILHILNGKRSKCFETLKISHSKLQYKIRYINHFKFGSKMALINL